MMAGRPNYKEGGVKSGGTSTVDRVLGSLCRVAVFSGPRLVRVTAVVPRGWIVFRDGCLGANPRDWDRIAWEMSTKESLVPPRAGTFLGMPVEYPDEAQRKAD